MYRKFKKWTDGFIASIVSERRCTEVRRTVHFGNVHQLNRCRSFCLKIPNRAIGHNGVAEGRVEKGCAIGDRVEQVGVGEVSERTICECEIHVSQHGAEELAIFAIRA